MPAITPIHFQARAGQCICRFTAVEIDRATPGTFRNAQENQAGRNPSGQPIRHQTGHIERNLLPTSSRTDRRHGIRAFAVRGATDVDPVSTLALPGKPGTAHHVCTGDAVPVVRQSQVRGSARADRNSRQQGRQAGTAEQDALAQPRAAHA